MPNEKLTAVATGPTGEESAIQVEVTLPVRPRRHESRKGGQPDAAQDTGSRARTPRITRLMALAIKFQDTVGRGEVRGYADLARLGYVTRARITQIMNLLNLAPDIQEQLLLPARPTMKIAERHLRSVASEVSWQRQRGLWNKIKTS